MIERLARAGVLQRRRDGRTVRLRVDPRFLAAAGNLGRRSPGPHPDLLGRALRSWRRPVPEPEAALALADFLAEHDQGGPLGLGAWPRQPS
jgi:hypothetical protein